MRPFDHGCLRLDEHQIQRLYERVREGTRIQIVNQPGTRTSCSSHAAQASRRRTTLPQALQSVAISTLSKLRR